MRIVSLTEIMESLSYINGSELAFDAPINAVRQAFIDESKGVIEQPQPMQILFKNDDDFIGDCHVKAAQKEDHPYFVIKVAAGFYQNMENGLPANSGLMLVMSTKTGYPIALLQDEGWLTQLRTAAAGAISQ